MLPISLRVLGLLLLLFSVTTIPPWWLSLYWQDGADSAFRLTTLITLSAGVVCWLSALKETRQLRTRDGFVIVTLLWTVLCLASALPFYFYHIDDFTWADSVFEAVSGLTTTGSTVISHIDKLPPSILYYRQQLQFLGGMGIILLAVAILPMLGIGGMQLFRAESTGPVKDNKLTPRITETAKALWYVYLGLTIACLLSYKLAGMSWFDAVCYAYSTVSTGGFAPHDDSLGYYPSYWVQAVAIVFMCLGSISFSLHFTALKQFSLDSYLKDAEFLLFCLLLASASLLIYVHLNQTNTFSSPVESAWQSVIHVASLLSTTGFISAQFSTWPAFAPHLILLLGLIGGCAGSTSGGIKQIRLILMIKQGTRELKKLVHPSGMFLIKLNQKAVPIRIIEAVWGFVAIYLLIFVLLTLLLLACDMNFETASSSVIASLANVGPALADNAEHFHYVSPAAKWIMSAAMLVGRLEVFTFLVLLSPSFWRS